MKFVVDRSKWRCGAESENKVGEGLMNWFIHFFRLLWEPSGHGRLFAFQPRRWRVKYKDGKYSMGMAYDVACDYAIIFGGTVERVEKND